jgi:hypothetical protein
MLQNSVNPAHTIWPQGYNVPGYSEYNLGYGRFGGYPGSVISVMIAAGFAIDGR